MATPYSAVNIVHMNQKQLQRIARDVGVAPITIMQNSQNQNGRGALITAIKAK